MSTLQPKTRRLSRVEYERMIGRVFDEDDPIELVDGELVVREPPSMPHATATLLVEEALRAAFGRGWSIRPQLPVALDDYSEPEPDVVVVPGRPRDYLKSHPTRPVLVVEVSLAKVAFDRGKKASVYARAGITDYWIVNVGKRMLEVYRDPAPVPSTRFGWKYRSVRLLKPGSTVSPLAKPRARVRVSAVLP